MLTKKKGSLRERGLPFGVAGPSAAEAANEG